MSHLRLAAVALRLDLARAVDLETFRSGMAGLLDRQVLVHQQAPTLVAFPEHTGLLAAFVGEPASGARERLAAGAPAVEALGELAGGHAAALDHAAGRFPQVGSLGALLQLALTDTLVRAVHETFSQLAAERGLWLSVGAAIADWEATADPAARAAIDPDGRRAEVYVATSPEVRNRNLVYAPDGTLAAVHDKAYLVPMERDHEAGLGLTAAGLADLEVADLPVGRIATVISKDAWMPDVNERLDQLGARILLQPEAFDRWGRVDRDGEVADLWPPDKFQRGGWWMVQRHRAFSANVAPMLVGDLGDLAFDGQALVAVPTPAGAAGLGLLGQPHDGGWAAVGPYGPLEDEPAELADPTRRSELEDLARRMAPGSGDPLEGSVAEGAVWADVEVPDRPAPLPLPAPLDVPASTELAVGTDTQLVPHLAADDDRTWLALVSCGHEPAQGVMVATDAGDGWGPPAPLAPEPARLHDQFDRQWGPRLTVVDGRPVGIYIAFPHESWDVYVAAPPADSARGPVRVDDAHAGDGVLRERGHDAPVLLADPREPGRLIAVWSDLRWPWVLPQVRCATSTDGGATWSPSVRVDGGPLDGEPDPLCGRSDAETRGQAAPSAAVTDQLLVAWQERDADGVPTIWLASDPDRTRHGLRRLSPPGSAAFRPQLATWGRTAWLVWEQEHPDGGGGLWWRRSEDGGLTFTPAAPLEDLPAGVVQRHACLAALDERRALVVLGDDRAGEERILAAVVDGEQTAWVRRVCDTPDGAQARVPTAARGAGRVTIAWQDTRTGTGRIRTTSVPLPGI